MVDDKMSTSYVPNGPVLHPSPNYQTNNLQLRTPQIFQFAQMKQEPIDDEKMDSGINSGGSDFQSSSPGSDQSSSDHYLNQPQYFSTPKIGQFPAFPQLTQQQQHPLTPPNSEPLISPNSGDCDETTLTPCSSPGTISNHDDSEIGNISDNNNDIKVPKVNSNSGKTKTMKCKQCSFACTTKEVFWDHIRTHIREDKRLSCTQCNFVTEYKHHLEYHLRNHAGSKPFKCPNCNYTCVNKSMLNSHMKSHSNIYQYHCADCNYATKYCHSLKLHLRKHGHQPGLVLDQEGKPNPLPIIDVYGTRRGPKMKPKNEQKHDKQPPKPEQESAMFPAPPPPTFIPPHLTLAFSLLNQFPSPDVAAARLNQLILERQLNENEADTESEANQGVLDLSQPSTSATAATTISGQQQSRSRRKGVAVKFVKTDQESDTENETKPEISTKEENNNETKSDDDDDDDDRQPQKTDHKEYRCQHCDMGFGDEVLYTLHMSFHGTNDPFSCNTCGIICENRIAFYVHITRNAH